ncbi:hypothetical protein LI187_13880 [bacterium 210820-DFI.6.38]|nr:hypothetical protein [bacterium 210820-DFI.6.38]
MIHIKKREPIESVQKELREKADSLEWKNIPETDTAAMRAVFDQLTCKQEIRQCLLEEQHYLCAYCMSAIENKELHMSIEHFVPLSKCKEKVLDYRNYLGVCKGGADLPRNRSKCICCDASKGNQELQCINPFNEAQMHQIKYLSDGVIYYERRESDSEEYEKAIQKDIFETLKLNGVYDKEKGIVKKDTKTSLVKNRKDAYEECESYIAELYANEMLTKEQLESDLQNIMERDHYEAYDGVRLFLLKMAYENLQQIPNM